MAPHATPTEVIEILSDDDTTARAIPAPLSSQVRPTSMLKAAVPDGTTRIKSRDGFVERSDGPSSSHSRHSTTLKAAEGSSSGPAQPHALPPTPIMPNGMVRDSGVTSSGTNGARHRSSKQLSRPIVLSDDDAPMRLPVRKPTFRPRGFSPEQSMNGPINTGNVQRSPAEKLSSPKKRLYESESPSSTPAALKKPKLAQTNSERKNVSRSSDHLPHSAKTSPTSPHEVQKLTAPNGSIRKPANKKTLVGSRSPSPRRRQKPPSARSGDEGSAHRSPASGRRSTTIQSRSTPNVDTQNGSASPKIRPQKHVGNPESSSWLSEKSANAHNSASVSNGRPNPGSAKSDTTKSLTESQFARPKLGAKASNNVRPLPSQPEPGSDPASSPYGSSLPSASKASHFETGNIGASRPKQSSPRPRSPSAHEAARPVDSYKDNGSPRASSAVKSQDASRPGVRRTTTAAADAAIAASLGPNLGRSSSKARDKYVLVTTPGLTPSEIMKIKREEGPQRYKELELARVEQRPVLDDGPGSHDCQRHDLNGLGARSARDSPDAIAFMQKDILKSVSPSRRKPADTRGTGKNPSTFETIACGHVVAESDAADLQLQSEARSAADHVAMPAYSSAFAHPTITASEIKARTALFSGLSTATRVEKVLGRYMEELRGDNEYWTSVFLNRARLFEASKTATSKTLDADEAPTSFAKLKPIQLVPHKKGSSSVKSGDTWGIQRIAADGKPLSQIEVAAHYTTFATDQQDVPDFAHYVSIRDNLLAPNIINLHCWPYFGDDFDMREAQNLSSQYNIDIVAREKQITVLLQAQMHEDYVESALKDLDCTWADVLRFLLEGNPDVGSDLDARKAYQNRALYCQDNFSRDSDRWQVVLARLPPSTPTKLGLVAVLCDNFLKMAKFSLWHIARKSPFANIPDESDHIGTAQPSDDAMTCRVCLRFNCPYHGQFKHRPDDSGGESDTESLSSVDTAVATDIIHPLKVNYRSRITCMPNARPNSDSNVIHDPQLRKKQRDQNYWNNYRHKADERGPFYPCHHPSLTCSDAKCSCYVKAIPCEKTCSCASDCARKFKGCSCGVRKGHQMVCAENPECVCWQNGRECDPDLCTSCGVCDVVDPVNKYNDQVLTGRCRNASIQRGVPKHTLLGDSGVHGLGLYACDDIKHHHFVGEYKGEIITKKEADRRGAVYEHQKLSYLFSLNKHQEIDSTYFGNKVRFINHAHGEKANLYPRIIMVNTVHRIALYASKDIPAGTELLFDYGPLFPDEQLQSKKSKKSASESKKSAPHVRNANLVKEFYDVSESEDEDGILRAKAVSHARARSNKKQNDKPRKPQVKKPTSLNETASKNASDGRRPGAEQDAGERLAAFNISDEAFSEAAEADVVPEDEEADDDAAFEPGDSESGESESSEDDTSDSDAADDDDDEDQGPISRGRGRPPGVNTRKRGRR